MKQYAMFGAEENSENNYSKKIEAPIYEPKNKKPHILKLRDKSKTKRLIREIESSNLPNEEKKFLKEAAERHTVFNYELIADYYANASPEMQDLMEKSALVIIDFEKAIELGFVQLSKELKKQYLEEYNEE